MNKIISIAFSILFSLTCASSFAQDGEASGVIEPSHVAKWNQVTNWEKHPRYEDHFWRRKVRIRVDLKEKINEPQLKAQANIYDENSRVYSSNKDSYEFNKGIIKALMSGYASGFMSGYNPDSLDSELEFNEFRAKYRKNTDAGGQSDPGEGGDGSELEEDGDDWDSDSGDDGASSSGGTQAKSDDVIAALPESAQDDFTDIMPFYDIIEDRIFDKNKSDMFYEPEYIVLYVKGPTTELPIVAFRYEDVKDTILNKCMWLNRFNDAEYKTLKEIIELRLFGSFVMNMSQYQSRTIDEADRLRLQMLEYEHNLWEF